MLAQYKNKFSNIIQKGNNSVMATKKKGLGKGLESLFEDNKVEISTKEDENAGSTGMIMININQIDPNRKQPRKKFDEEKLQEMAESIREHGVIEPLVLKKVNSRYQIIAGERRWRAARLAKLKEVPAVIGNYSDREIVEVALIENLQREDLNPIEEAQAYKNLIDEYGLRQEEVAERVSKKRVTITNSMRLLKLDERVQEMLIDGKLSSGHARSLLAIEDKDHQYEVAQKIVEDKMSVREIEKMIRDEEKSSQKKETKKPLRNQAEYKEYEKQMSVKTGVKVEVQLKAENKGKIIIPYSSAVEFERIYKMLIKD